MSMQDDLDFLRECCKTCVAGMPARSNPAVVRAGEMLEQRISSIEQTLVAAQARTDGAGPRLLRSAKNQVRALAYTLAGFTPAVKLDARQRRRVELLIDPEGAAPYTGGQPS